jgi:general secretion pathway protein D
LTIKDTPEHIAAAARLLSAIDKARPEVIIDVELLEIDRTRLLEYGLQIASPGSPGLNGSATIAPGGSTSQAITLQTLKNLSQSDILLTSLPGLYYRRSRPTRTPERSRTRSFGRRRASRPPRGSAIAFRCP